MTEITFLGVGGAMAAQPASNHTALVVRHDDAGILLDCGPSIMSQLECAEISPGDLTHIIVSHQHGDHSLGLPMLLLNRVFFWPEQQLVLAGAPPVLSGLQALMALAYPDMLARVEKLATFVTMDVGPVALPLPGASGIASRLAPGSHSVPSWGIRLDFTSGRSLTYSSDTGPSNHIARLAHKTDLLAHDTFFIVQPEVAELNHSAAGDVGELAAQADVKALALIHRQDTQPAAKARYRAEAETYFGGKILIPDAGDRVTL